jgi:hypothetical protein
MSPTLESPVKVGVEVGLFVKSLFTTERITTQRTPITSVALLPLVAAICEIIARN